MRAQARRPRTLSILVDLEAHKAERYRWSAMASSNLIYMPERIM